MLGYGPPLRRFPSSLRVRLPLPGAKEAIRSRKANLTPNLGLLVKQAIMAVFPAVALRRTPEVRLGSAIRPGLLINLLVLIAFIYSLRGKISRTPRSWP